MISIIENRAVKTRSFRNPKYVGDPANTVALFSSFEAEELIVLDIGRSFGKEGTSLNQLSIIVSNAYMPIAYGGGVYTLEDATKMFDIGFDKIVLKSQLLTDALPNAIARKYGGQAVTGCLDVRVSNDQDLAEVNGLPFQRGQVRKLCRGLEEAGVGELIIQDINRDGTRLGLDPHWVLEEALNSSNIPVVPLGGCRNVKEAEAFIHETKCHSVAASTMFLFQPTRDAVLVTYPQIGEWRRMMEVSD